MKSKSVLWLFSIHFVVFLEVGALPVNKSLSVPGSDDDIKKSKLLAKWQFQQEAGMKLDVDKLKPPDHMEGVKMEQDGDINKDYKKEVILGNHDHAEEESDDQSEARLRDIFFKVDTDHDGVLTEHELEAWIAQKIQEHLDEAMEENTKIFRLLDPDHDGHITWQEYMKQFLMVHGHNGTEIDQHVLDYDTVDLGEKHKDELIRYKFRWSEADRRPVDNQLTEEEFLTFRHPEQSVAMMDTMVKEIMDSLDKNKNAFLTEDEFVVLPKGEVVEGGAEVDRQWLEERRQEFHEIVDKNKDGKVSKGELRDYLNPRHPNHAKMEASNLIKLTDGDGDGKLTVEEVLRSKDIFLGSKMVDTGKSFHDEF